MRKPGGVHLANQFSLAPGKSLGSNLGLGQHTGEQELWPQSSKATICSYGDYLPLL